ncbi:MAG: response regulator [Polyangiaceae bacterium]|nr:response regulator [Polyangiaceae bacterium]
MDDQSKGVESAASMVEPPHRVLLEPRRPFLLLVVVLLAAVGSSTTVGVFGLSWLDQTFRHVGEHDARRLVVVTHVRRLFRSELLLLERARKHPHGPTVERFEERRLAIEAERQAQLEELARLVEPSEQGELEELWRQHRLGRELVDQHTQPWEQVIATLLTATEAHLTQIAGQARSQTRSSLLLLLTVSAASVVFAIILGRAVTRRIRRIQQDLADRSRQLLAVVDSAPSLLTIIAPNGQLAFLPEKASRFLGVAASRLMDDPFVWLREGSRPRVVSAFAETLRFRQPFPAIEVEGIRDDSTLWHALVSLTRLDTHDDSGGVLVQILDLTARHEAEQARLALEAQVRQKHKMESVGHLAGGIAHDFNNLLTAIIGHASLLDMDVPPESPMRESVEGVLAAADRAAQLTQQLLAFSRKQVLSPRPANIGEIVTRIHGLLARTLGEDVRLSVEIASDLRLCEVDVGQVEQVVINLAVNARQAMPDGGRLVIEATNVVLDEEEAACRPGAKPGAFVQLCVSDTGVGMSAAVQQQAFEPFFTTKPVGQGTGLGLSVVQGVVQQQGGTISVYSAEGVGTTFRILWPAVEGARDDRGKPPAPPSLVGGTETILLVEDDPLVRSFATRALRRHGYRVIETECAEDAVAVLEQSAPTVELMVTDLVLPGKSGRELADELAEKAPGVPVVFCSGYTGRLATQTGRLPEGARFLQKPYDTIDLIRQVRAALDGAPAPSRG